jgi:hypothetical protein
MFGNHAEPGVIELSQIDDICMHEPKLGQKRIAGKCLEKGSAPGAVETVCSRRTAGDPCQIRPCRVTKPVLPVMLPWLIQHVH